MRVLIVANECQVAQDIILFLRLRYQGMEQLRVEKASDCFKLVEEAVLDLIMLDSAVPDIPPEMAIRRIREFSNVPIIVLTKAQAFEEKARFLEDGADECIAKPVNCVECLSVTNALLRRNAGLGFKSEKTMQIDQQLKINFDTRDLTGSGVHIHLTPIEFNLLSILAKNHGQILTYETLLERIWGANYVGDFSLLKKHIHNLRSKIEADPANPQIVVNDRGLGYRLIALQS